MSSPAYPGVGFEKNRFVLFRFHGEMERNEMAQKETKRKCFLETGTKLNGNGKKIPEFQYPAYEGPQNHMFSLLKNQILTFNQFL